MRIDWWTLGIQTVNVAILVWLLQRFFWRPVAAIIETRRTTTAKALADAKDAGDSAAEALAGVARTRAGFAAEHDAILQQAHAAAAQASAAAQEAAGQKAAALEAAETKAAAAAREAGEQAWTEHASRLAADMASRLARRLDGPAVQASFLAWLLEQLRAMPEIARQAAGSAPIEAVSATPIAEADQARTTGLIAATLGGHPVITYRTDPALIAGLELHGPHLSVTNSWQADLTRILEDVGRDRKA